MNPNLAASTTWSRRPLTARPMSSSLVYGPHAWAVSIGVTPRSTDADEQTDLLASMGRAEQAGLVGGDDELGAVARIEFHEQAADVGLGGGEADVQLGRDLGVGQAEPDQGQDFALPFGYRLQHGRRALPGAGAPGELGDEPPGDARGERRAAGPDGPDRGQQARRRGVLGPQAPAPRAPPGAASPVG